MIRRQILRWSLVLFLVFPFLFLFTQFRGASGLSADEVLWAFKNSFYQASLSSFLSIFVGLWVALGLLSVKSSKLRKGAELLCLLPNFLPPLFSLLSILNAIDFFPMGLLGIVFVHVFLNFGMVAVLFSHIIEDKLGAVLELSYVEGASRFQVWSRVLIPMLYKEIVQIALFVFIVCFGSFSVPLVVGGGMGTTVEVLIYEKVRLSGDWGHASILAFLQSVFIFLIYLGLGQKFTHTLSRRFYLKFISLRSGLFILFLATSILIFGYSVGFIRGLYKLDSFNGMLGDLVKAFAGSLMLGLSTGALVFFALMSIAFVWSQSWFDKFLSGYVAPSTALTCFSILVIGPNEGLFVFVKIPLALLCLNLNSLYRMGWDSAIRNLQPQLVVAQTLGASETMIFCRVLFPQLLEKAGVLSGIAALWACGDFAVSRILAHKEISLGMITDSLMTNYRLDQATLLSSSVVISGCICFMCFKEGSRVVRRKLEA